MSPAPSVVVRQVLLPCAGNAGALRTEIRHKYDIRRGLIPDWMVHTFCCPCGWCQEAKEMQVTALLACILPGSADWGAHSILAVGEVIRSQLLSELQLRCSHCCKWCST